MIRRPVLLLLFVMSVFFTGWPVHAALQQKASEAVCYSYLLQGDVWVSCGGKRQQLTDMGDVEDFAVTPGGKGLAMERSDWKLETFLLSPDGVLHHRSAPAPPYRLLPSCGLVLVALSQPTSYLDPFTGRSIAKPPYVDFQCSSDGKTVVGFLNQDGLVLETGIPPRKIYESPRPYEGVPMGVQQYAISKNGEFVAYNADSFCVQRIGEWRKCIKAGNYSGRISVSDSGGVLYTIATHQVCYYKDSWHVSATPRPGYNGSDECFALAYWRPGEKSSTMLQFLAEDPQWLTPETASRLIELSQHLADGIKKSVAATSKK